MARVVARAVRTRQRPLRDDVLDPLRGGRAAALGRPTPRRSWPWPAGGPGPTTPAVASSRHQVVRRLADHYERCGSPAGRGDAVAPLPSRPEATAAGDGDRRRARPGRAGPPAARGPGPRRGPRPDVAPARPPRVAPRPASAPARCWPRPAGASSARPSRRSLYRPRSAVPRRGPLDGGRRRPGRRGPRRCSGPRRVRRADPVGPTGGSGPSGPARRWASGRPGLDPNPTARRPAAGGSRRRGHPVLRPHRGRRGPGPLAHAAADAGPALALGLDDRGRRHRPGHRAVGPAQLGRGHRAPDPTPTAPPGRADGQLPHPGRGGRGGGPGAGRGRPRPSPRPARCAARAAAPVSSRPPRGPWPSGWPRRRPQPRWPRWPRAGRPCWSPAVLVPELARALAGRGLDPVDPRDPRGEGLAAPLVLLPADEANGLEFDAVVVVEPALIAAGGPSGARRSARRPTTRGLRTLYVALTRPTRRLAVVHSLALPVDLALAGATGRRSALSPARRASDRTSHSTRPRADPGAGGPSTRMLAPRWPRSTRKYAVSQAISVDSRPSPAHRPRPAADAGHRASSSGWAPS